ncbi:acyl-CoA dehydrogenase family protein [Streptomyces hygroscopicus]|uniref:acyl-CoA dehydrogenase family protein n=1 Tax=Streptomyces hygroscopicus TaxID=1912 RepID=UPI0036363C3D
MKNQLRAEVRRIVTASGITPYTRCDAWMRGHDPRFTAALAEAGLIGLTWPKDLGGRGSGNVDRLVVTEELLRVGAPVAAHWIADRQIGPAILRHGTPQMQQAFLPRIATGEVTFCLGMSEPDSGSDLAAVRTRAVPADGGYRLTGTKIWTSHAHRSTHAYVLARTDATGAKHEGLTEFVVDLSAEGVEVRPIVDLAGEYHFNETVFTDVFVPADHVIGAVGQGWKQVTEQLAFERGGMERVLSTYPLLAVAADRSRGVDPLPAALGSLAARLHTLRAMAGGIARAMDEGKAPVQQAALLKHLGTTFEGEVVDFFRDSVSAPPLTGHPLTELLAEGIVSSPGTTLRGGATEVLLTIIGREALSPRLEHGAGWSVGDPDLVDLVGQVLRSQAPGASGDGMPSIWSTAVELGWTGIGAEESAGGSGGGKSDLAAVVHGLARAGMSAPVAETALAGHLLAAAGRKVDPAEAMTVALGRGFRATRTPSGWQVDGQAAGVPWARMARHLLVAAETGHGEVILRVPRDAAGLEVQPQLNVADEPRDTLVLDAVVVEDDALVARGTDVARARRTAGTLLLAATVGALEGALEAAIDHVRVREQFGKPLAAFQAVSHTVARMTAEVAAARVAFDEALAEDDRDGAGWRVLAGRITASRASSLVSRSAHQLLGAMGITHEHSLHRWTLRLWAWRDEQVSEREAARRLGAAVLDSGPEALWDWCVQERDNLSATLAPWTEEEHEG